LDNSPANIVTNAKPLDCWLVVVLGEAFTVRPSNERACSRPCARLPFQGYRPRRRRL
jgi:hypothetical protein